MILNSTNIMMIIIIAIHIITMANNYRRYNYWKNYYRYIQY